MSDIHALSGAYALDALDDIERAQFQRHLAECADCRDEVRGLRETAGLLAGASAAAPPPALRDRVLADIATVRPLPPLSVPAARPSRRLHLRLDALVAAAAAVLAIGAGAVVWQPWTDDAPSTQTVSMTDQVLQSPDAETVRQKLPDGVEATLVRSKTLHRAVIVTKNMPSPPPGKVYQLWLQDPEDGMVPAGLMPSTADTMLLEGDPTSAVGAGITLEPAGGSTVPTSEPTVIFAFDSA